MKKIIIIVGLITITINSYSQFIDSISISDCYHLLNTNFPIVKQKVLIEASENYKLKNINTQLLPQLNLQAQATYQSTGLELQLPMLQAASTVEVPKDQYKIYLEFSQVLYDGGITNQMKSVEKQNTKIEKQKVEIQMHQLRSQISQTYHTILLLQEQEEIVNNLYETLLTNKNSINSGIKHGAINPVNRDIINAELLKVEQQKEEIILNKTIAYKALSLLTDTTISIKTKLIVPDFKVNSNDSTKRPEIYLYDYQYDKINKLQSLNTRKRIPKLGVFAQAGYGKPGLNMLSNEFEPYYIVGANLHWNIFDWNKTKREKYLLDISKSTINIQKQTFEIQNNIKAETEKNNINKLKLQIEKDQQIIILKEKIIKVYDSQLKNGIISINEYLVELNSFTQAKLNKKLHQIQLLLSISNYNNIIGTIN